MPDKLTLEIDKLHTNKLSIIWKLSWIDRLFCFHAGLDEFVEEPEDEYDLIKSTILFRNYKTENEQRDLHVFKKPCLLRI
jgi:hypothetical protein